MSWWDDETETLAEQVTTRFGRDAVTGCMLAAVAVSMRENGHPIDGHPNGTGVTGSDLKAAIKSELRQLLTQVH
jgi:hypothetical protein